MQKILPDNNPTDLNAWKSLQKHFQKINKTTLKDHFKN